LITGRRYDASMHQEYDLDAIYAMMEEAGFSDKGYSKMIDPNTGELLNVSVFSGYMSQRMLEHLADRKFNVNTTAAKDITTRRPLQGGYQGLRKLGEMEITALLGHGATNVLQEIMMESNAYEAAVCRRCGTFSDVNVRTQEITCNLCREEADPVHVKLMYMFKLIHNLLAAAGVLLYFKFSESSSQIVLEDDLEYEFDENEQEDILVSEFQDDEDYVFFAEDD
jgi:DNA-directed RNA polymerase beta subunit